MKKLSVIIILLSVITLSSCKKEEPIDETLIPGRWNTGTLYYVFSADGLGYTWDTADDVTEDEAQQLTWSVSSRQLNVSYIGEMGEIIPKTYTIKSLTSSTFMFSDDYGNTTTLNRIKQ